MWTALGHWPIIFPLSDARHMPPPPSPSVCFSTAVLQIPLNLNPGPSRGAKIKATRACWCVFSYLTWEAGCFEAGGHEGLVRGGGGGPVS